VLEVIRAGRLPYDEALRWQERLVEERLGGGPDRLLLCEHPPVVTLGRNADRAHILADDGRLAAGGIEVHLAPRGGDVTFHGPGQLVAYPIVGLPPERRNVRQYVSDVEEVVIRTLADFDVYGERVEGLRGVWVGREKVAAVGVRIWRWVTSHGLALNVAPDLSCFDLIVPCGIADRGVTSLERLLGRAPSLRQVEDALIVHALELLTSGSRPA
jgi:lipoyl(octanoyl) transferase